MKRSSILLVLTLLLQGCTPIEKTAYNTVVAAKAFLDSVKLKHPECNDGAVSPICGNLKRATAAKDLLIDAGEVYCSGSDFAAGGACQPPAKGTASYDIAIGKLKDALSNYDQIESDLRGVL